MPDQQQTSWVEARVQALLAQQDWPVGRNLRDVRAQQEAAGVRRESYDIGHLKNLVLYEDRRKSGPAPRRGGKVLCSHVHGPHCTDCTTCHFCRQKIVGEKTFCACGNACGIWCEDCLYIRMGEDIRQALRLCQAGQWRCPVCRGICNCSGANCLRLMNGWETTGQLTHEAKKLGYRSVAHYLILTALDRAAPESGVYRASAAAGARGVPRAAQAARHGQPATHQHLQQRARLAKAERDNARMLQACKAVFAPVMAGMQQADTGRSIAQDILDADDDGEAGFELPSLGGMRQPAAAGLLSPGSFNTPGVPQPLFNGAGGAAAGPNGSRQQQQALQQQRRSSARPSPTTAAAGGAGRPHPQSAAGSAAAAEGGAPAVDYQDGQPAAEEVNPLVALGFEVSPEDLGVLGIRGWSTGPSAAQTLPADAAAATGLGAAATSDAAAAGVYGSEADACRSAGGAAAAASGGAASWGPHAQHAPPPQQQQQQRLRTAALGQGGLAGRQPQQQQQGQQQQQQQSEQGRTRSQQPQGQSMPAQHPGSAAEPEFGPEDLPGANAPGYGPRSSFYQPSQRTRRTAARASGRRSQLPPGGSTGTSNPAAARHTAAAVPSRPSLAEEPAAKRARLQQQQPAAGAGTGTPAGEDDDAVLADHFSPSFDAAMGSPSAAAAATAAAAALSAADSDQPDAKRARLSAAASEDSSGDGAAVPQPPKTFDQQQQQERTGADSDGDGILEFPVFAPFLQPQQQGGQQQQQPQGMLERALWCRQQVEELMQEGIGPEGLPYDELCHELTRIMNAGLDANSDFDKALVAGSLGADVPYQLDKACELLVFLSKFVPPDRLEDIVRRLSSEPVLDFAASGPAARGKVLTTAAEILVNVLVRRGQPSAAVYEAWVALGSPVTFTSDTSPVEQLAEAALNNISLVQQCMEDVVECILGWMSVMHEEVARAGAKLKSTDLLGPMKLGPIEWHAVHCDLQQHFNTAAPGAEDALQPAEVSQERKLRLEGLLKANTDLLTSLARCLQNMAGELPRRLAAMVLSGPVTAGLLDLDVDYTAEARSAFLGMAASLLRRAAPDLLQDNQWRVQDPQRMLQELPGQHQLLLQQHPVRGLLDSYAAQEYSVQLLQVLARQSVDAAARQQELAALCAEALPQLLPPVERMVECHYLFRGGSRPAQGAATRAPEQLSELQAASGAVHPVLQQYCVSLGGAKVELLAALYALQLQAGGVSWAEAEHRMALPAQTLEIFCKMGTYPAYHRRFVLFLAAQTAASAPGLIQWGAADNGRPQQQGGQVKRASGCWNGTNRHAGGIYPSWQQQAGSTGPAPAQQAAVGASVSTSGPGIIPPSVLLRLCVGCTLDQHSRLTRAKCVELVCSLLARSPATAALFGSARWLQQPGLLEQQLLVDADGRMHGQILKMVLTAVGSTQGPHRLAKVLRDLHEDLKVWQKAGVPHTQLLTWQHHCMPTLLAIAELILAYPSIDAALPLQQLMAIMTSWIQEGIRAVCGRRVQLDGSGGDAQGLCSPTSSSGGTVATAQQYVQASALHHLPEFLNLLVHLAGLAGKLEGTSTAAWPAHIVSGSAQTLQQAVQQCCRSRPALPAGLRQQIEVVTCLQDVLGTALQYLSGKDRPEPQDIALLDCMAAALEQAGGLSQHGRLGYCSPGLLHHVFSRHLHAVVKAAADRNAVLDVHRAVNALHMVRVLLQRRSMLQPSSQQLLLPTLAFPLLEVLKAASGHCLRVRLQVYVLLQQLLTGADARELLPGPGQEPSGPPGPVQFQDGALCRLVPLTQAQVQLMFHLLMKLSLRSCLTLLEAEAAPGGPHTAAIHHQTQQQQQQLGLLRQDVTDVNNRLLSILGRARAPQAIPYQVEAPTPRRSWSSSGAAVGLSPPEVTATPQDYCWRVLQVALGFAARLVGQQQSTAAEAVRGTLLPALHSHCSSNPYTWQRLRQKYTALLQQLPQAEQQKWAVPDAVRMLPPRPAAGVNVPQQQPTHQQAQQQMHQASPKGHQQQGQRKQPGPAAYTARAAAPQAAAAASQACSVAAPGPAAAAAAAAAVADQQRRVKVPAASQGFRDGGRAASCSVNDGSQTAGTAAAAAAAARRGQPARPPVQQLDAEDADCCSSGVRNSSQHKKQRLDATTQQQQQQQQQPDEGCRDVCSQDQGQLQQQQAVQQRRQQQHQNFQQQQQPVSGNSNQPSRKSLSSASGPGSAGNGVRFQSLLGYLEGCVPVDTAAGADAGAGDAGAGAGAGPHAAAAGSSKPRQQTYLLKVKQDTGPVPSTPITLTGSLADRAKSYLQRKLLEPGDQVLLTKLIGPGDSRKPVRVSDLSQLLVDPRRAIAAGLRYTQEDRDTWEGKWRQWRRYQEQQKRKSSEQQAGQQPAGAAQQPHTRPDAVQKQKQHQQPSTPAAGQPSCLNQPNRARQQEPPVAPPLQQVQQQPVALLPQQQQQHQGCAAAQAGAQAPGDQRPNGTVQQSPAGVAAGAGGQAVGGGAADIQAVDGPQASSQPDGLEDSQATIKYMTLPSNY